MSLISGDTTLIQILICVRVDIGNEIFSGHSVASIYELLYGINYAIVPIGGVHVWAHTCTCTCSLIYVAWLYTQQSIWFNLHATKLFIVTSATKGVVTTPPRFRVRFKILYRVIQVLIQHCLLRRMVYLNIIYVIATQN